MPRLLRDVSSIVCGPANVDSVDLFTLIARLRKFRADLVGLCTELDVLSLRALKSEGVVSLDVDERTQLLGDVLSLLIMGCRLLCGVSMDTLGTLENEALAYSNQLIELERKATLSNSFASFVLYQKLSLAQATLKTAHVWRKDSSQINIVERSAFKAWCDAIPVCCSSS
jgi:hypothetical protein